MFDHLGNSDNPLESLFKRPSFPFCDQNPISKQDDSPFFSNFPSPFFDEQELPLNQILLMTGNHADQITDPKKETAKCCVNGASKLKEKAYDHQQILSSTGHVTVPLRRRNLGVAPKKRSGKKDRHSKICTAQGIRDRRMRLSLQVARKFFDLQDLLGYDKASKTIEWLFNKSKKAIKDLSKNNPQRKNLSISTDAKSESFISECEVVSGIEENFSNCSEIKEGMVPSPFYVKSCEKEEKKLHKPNTRESREKARARARCRTRDKMMIKGLENWSQWCKSSPIHHNDLEKLGSSNSPFEGVNDQESHNQERVCVSPYGIDYSSLLVSQLGDVGTIEKLLGDSNSDYHCSAAVSCCIDPNSSFMGFLGNWDLFNNDRLNSSTQYAVTNQLPFAGNSNSIYSAASTPDFPFFHQ